jgi:hypothetical protein
MKRESVMPAENPMAETRFDPVHFFHKEKIKFGVLFIGKTS